EEREKSLHLLRKARRFIRGELAHALRFRVAPELTFLLDDSSEYYIRIAKVLDDIEEENSEERGGRPDEDGGGEPQEDTGSP
ncbi:MAG: ribosome-binding factor A, partial [Candidatus Eisenbacteria bacterium]|nr:ribosome-binding factor A [Candidatus Eisenbacteria bacterium]